MITESKQLEKIERKSSYVKIIIDKENTLFIYNNIYYNILSYKENEDITYYTLLNLVRFYYLPNKSNYSLRINIDYKNDAIIFNLFNDTALRRYELSDLRSLVKQGYFYTSIKKLIIDINKFDANPIIFQAPNIELFNIEYDYFNKSIKIFSYDCVNHKDIDIDLELKPV